MDTIGGVLKDIAANGNQFIKWIEYPGENTSSSSSSASLLPQGRAGASSSPRPVSSDRGSRNSNTGSTRQLIENRVVLPPIIRQSSPTSVKMTTSSVVAPSSTALARQQQQQQQNSEPVGIGVELEQLDDGGRVFISRMAPGGPAAETVLQVGDGIIRVDGIVVQGLDVTEIANYIRGPEGSTVKLEVVSKQSSSLAEAVIVNVVRRRVAPMVASEASSSSLFADAQPTVSKQQQDLDVSCGYGIGISLRRETNGQTVVTQIKRGGPAYSSALSVGDILLRIDGKDVYAMTVEELAAAVRGANGSVVSIVACQPNIYQKYGLAPSAIPLQPTQNKLVNLVRGPVGGSLVENSPIVTREPAKKDLEEEGDVGIGVTLEQLMDERILVQNIHPMGPAANSGLAVGDILLRVNGLPTHSMSVDDVADMIKGKAGTDVVLHIIRKKYQNEDFLSITIKRGTTSNNKNVNERIVPIKSQRSLVFDETSEPEQPRTRSSSIEEKPARSEYAGIGVTLEQDEFSSQISVWTVANEGPAHGKLMPNDVIVAVDGLDVAGLNISQLATLIRGPPNTSVELEIHRPRMGVAGTWGVEHLFVKVERKFYDEIRATKSNKALQSELQLQKEKERQQQIQREKEQQIQREKEQQIQREKEQQIQREKEQQIQREKEQQIQREKEQRERELQLHKAREEQLLREREARKHLQTASSPLKSASIGIGLEQKQGHAYIAQIFNDGSAFGSVLEAGQRVLSIGGRSTDNVPLDQVASWLLGPDGSVCTLDVVWPGRTDDEYMTVRVKRRQNNNNNQQKLINQTKNDIINNNNNNNNNQGNKGSASREPAFSSMWMAM